jgi:aminoglycoside 3-N-acetyltransferase I
MKKRASMKSTNYSFRRLAPFDVPTMRHLLEVYAEAFEDPVSYQKMPPTNEYLSDLLTKPHVITVVAEAPEHGVVAGLSAYVLDKFEQDRREIYIYDLAVLEPHRRRGVATGLIAELKRIAAELDVYVIFVQADLVDAPAIALYESLGTKETAHHFDIEVTRLPTRST